jgi:glycosyltransferase involved in cell wall biosynthesis
MRKFKIAIYCGEIPPPTFIDRLINGLAEKGNKLILVGKLTRKVSYKSNHVKIIGYSGKISKTFILLYYSVLLSLFQNKEKKKLKNWMELNSKYNNISKIRYYPILYNRPDVFHLQWIKGIEDWVWVREFDIKLIVSLRGAHINYTPICEPKYAEIYKRYFPLVDGFHGVSKAIMQEAIKYNSTLEKSKVVYSGLNTKNMSFNLTKKSVEHLQILSVGRNHWKKGYRYALDCMRILKDRNVKFTYTIVGVDEDEELLFQRKQLDLLKEVFFVPKLGFNDVIEKMKKANMLLLPSLEEGIANVVLEAMAIGTVVVSSDCGGMKEVIKHNENGFLVPVRNSKDMAQAILDASQLSESESSKMLLSARDQIEKQHNEKNMIHGILTLYKHSYEFKNS